MSDSDLYDDLDEKNESNSSVDKQNDRSSSNSSNNFSSRQSSYSVYIGNLTWWTTDLNLIEVMKNLGINDVNEIKFYENKNNGQSKGFCIVTLGSENSSRIALDQLPTKELHGQNPIVTVCTKQNLQYFESQSKKEGHGSNRHDKFKDKRYKDQDHEFKGNKNKSNYNRSRPFDNRNENYSRQQQYAHHQDSNIQHSFQTTPVANSQPSYTPWPPAIQMQIPPQIYPGPSPINAGVPLAPPGMPIPPNMRPPPPRVNLPPMGPRNMLPPDVRGPPPPGMPQMPHVVGPHDRPPPFAPAPAQGLHSMPPPSIPGSHINPPFYHQQSVPSGPPPEIYNRPPQGQFSHTERSDQYHSTIDKSKEASINEAEFEDIMNRNKSVSSNAISRAISDASAGDFANAIETLVTAISLIKQSKIGSDERCKILINSLQDTLHGIESKLYRSRSKERSPSRERERERPSRREKSSRRDRSRSRDREYRDRSREKDRHHEERYREKDRDHRSSRR